MCLDIGSFLKPGCCFFTTAGFCFHDEGLAVPSGNKNRQKEKVFVKEGFINHVKANL